MLLHPRSTVIKRRGQGIPPGYYECGPSYYRKIERKIEPREIPHCFIPCLLVAFTRQLGSLSGIPASLYIIKLLEVLLNRYFLLPLPIFNLVQSCMNSCCKPDCVHDFYQQLSVKNCFIRGSVVRYVQLPAEEVDTSLLQDATRKEAAQNKT